MSVFLHIGSHKTGTTAIQDFATVHRDMLQANGLIYPSFDLIGGRRERSHLGLVNYLLQGKPAPEGADPVGLLRTARDLAESQGKDLLFSAESLFRLSAEDARKVCASFRGAFGDTPFTIVCSLRPQAEFAESLYRNSYRSYTKEPEDFTAWLEASQHKFQYARIVSAYLELLDATPLLLPYSREVREGFIASFFSRLGVLVNTDETAPSERNPSLDTVDCLAKKAVLGAGQDARMSRAFNNFAFKNRMQTNYAFLGRRAEEAFISSLEWDNAALLEIEPALESVLGEDTSRLGKDDIDEKCLELSRQRAAEFWETRK